jgi:hypothetical protein
MHTYSIEFRILSKKDDIDFDEITDNLGIAPSNVRKRGEPKSASSKFNMSMWGYEEVPGKEWNSMEEALESILTVLTPLRNKIMEYKKRHKVVLWCGHFTSSFDGGPIFSPDILKKLGDFGVELIIDTYCSDE